MNRIAKKLQIDISNVSSAACCALPSLATYSNSRRFGTPQALSAFAAVGFAAVCFATTTCHHHLAVIARARLAISWRLCRKSRSQPAVFKSPASLQFIHLPRCRFQVSECTKAKHANSGIHRRSSVLKHKSKLAHHGRSVEDIAWNQGLYASPGAKSLQDGTDT